MTDDVLSDSIRRKPDAELHTGGRRQVQLPLQLQVAFRGRLERT
jgi:hypothetical protein